MPKRADSTYIEDLKDSDQIKSPDGNLVSIGLRVEKPGGNIPFTLLYDLPLDLGHCSTIGSSVSGLARMCIRRCRCSLLS